MKTIAVIAILILFGCLAFYERSYFSRAPISQGQCQEWYKDGFDAWKDWKTLPSNKKAELLRLSANIDDVISGACDCLSTRSKIFRENILTKHGIADTSSYIDQEIAEVKKFQLECKVPDFFTWATPEAPGAQSPD